MPDNVMRFPPPSGRVQLRTLLNKHLGNYPDAASRKLAVRQLEKMGVVTSVILGPGAFQELGLQPLVDRKVIVNRGKGEYGAVDADTKRFFASMEIDAEGFIQ